MVAGNVFREVTDQVWSPEKRIHDMERENVDIQVLSPIPVTFSYWAPPEAADYPFLLREFPPGHVIDDTMGLTEE